MSNDNRWLSGNTTTTTKTSSRSDVRARRVLNDRSYNSRENRNVNKPCHSHVGLIAIPTMPQARQWTYTVQFVHCAARPPNADEIRKIRVTARRVVSQSDDEHYNYLGGPSKQSWHRRQRKRLTQLEYFTFKKPRPARVILFSSSKYFLRWSTLKSLRTFYRATIKGRQC